MICTVCRVTSPPTLFALDHVGSVAHSRPPPPRTTSMVEGRAEVEDEDDIEGNKITTWSAEPDA